jgi:hypothetical protein
VLSGRGLCDELITRAEESYRLWCIVMCDVETSRIGAPYIYDISSLRVKECTEASDGQGQEISVLCLIHPKCYMFHICTVFTLSK